MSQPIYFLPSHGAHISNGLGQELARRDFEVWGRETVGDFKKLDFEMQIETVAADLKRGFLGDDSLVIANSYGAYLLLHALSSIEVFNRKDLLLSPILGEFSSETIRIGFIPPYATRLYELAKKGLYPYLKNCEIHVGSEDWKSFPDNVISFSSLVNARVKLVKGAGNSLPKEYVAALLDRWLRR